LNELIASKTPFKKSSKGKQEYLIIATGGLRKKVKKKQKYVFFILFIIFDIKE